MKEILLVSGIAGAVFGGVGYLILSLIGVEGAGTVALSAGLMFFSLLGMVLYTMMLMNNKKAAMFNAAAKLVQGNVLYGGDADIKGLHAGRLYICDDRFVLMSAKKKNVRLERILYSDVQKIETRRHTPTNAIEIHILLKEGGDYLLTMLNGDKVEKVLRGLGLVE